MKELEAEMCWNGQALYNILQPAAYYNLLQKLASIFDILLLKGMTIEYKLAKTSHCFSFLTVWTEVAGYYLNLKESMSARKRVYVFLTILSIVSSSITFYWQAPLIGTSRVLLKCPINIENFDGTILQ